MKSIILFFFLFITCFLLKAQEEKSPTVQYLHKRGYSFVPTYQDTGAEGRRKWPDTLYYNTRYKATLLGSPTIPISFSKIERVNGQFQVNPTISIGYGYTFFLGHFVFTQTDEIQVKPSFFFGPIFDVGLQNNLNLNKLTSIFTGVFIGFASFSLFAGYDYLSGSASLGLGGRIDVYTFFQNALKPFGKVKEDIRHKTGAVPIRNE
jgi:hypothetical protein